MLGRTAHCSCGSAQSGRARTPGSPAGDSSNPHILDVEKFHADKSVRAHKLVGGVAGFLCRGLGGVLGRAFLGTEVLGQVIQHGVAIGVWDDGAEAFHFFKLVGPLLAGQVLLGDAAGVMARSAGGLHFGLHGSGRKRLAWSTWRLRARQDDGCEQKDCRIHSLEQAKSPSVLKNWMCCVVCGCYFFALVCDCDVDWRVGKRIARYRWSSMWMVSRMVLPTISRLLGLSLSMVSCGV